LFGLVVVSGVTINDTLLAIIVSGLIGVVSTWLAAILKFRKDIEIEYDKDLRAKRLEVYK
jgi:hypothetical protein